MTGKKSLGLESKKISFKKFKSPPLGKVPVNVLIPNFLTLIALCSGFSSVYFALNENWESAVIFIFTAAFFDALDGRIARLIGGSSRFGAELDSLSDFVSFGVAPSLIIYLYSLNQIGKWGWVGPLFYTVACALRLARFNTLSIEEDTKKPFSPAWSSRFFLGVPVPAGAGIALMPLMIEFETEFSFQPPAFVYLFVLIFSGLLMVSRVHAYSFKSLHLHRRLILPVFVGLGLFIAEFITAPWLTLIVIGFLYLVSLPFSNREYRRLMKSSPS